MMSQLLRRLTLGRTECTVRPTFRTDGRYYPSAIAIVRKLDSDASVRPLSLSVHAATDPETELEALRTIERTVSGGSSAFA